jgi:hypothetical protein
VFWWFQSRLESIGLCPDLVDILHAGLSKKHDSNVLIKFEMNHIHILLSSEKLGAGINFQGVGRAVQYLCTLIILPRLAQRFGHAA